MSPVRRVNLFAEEVEARSGRPDGYGLAWSRLGPQIGAVKLGATVYELPPGQSTFPYHYEYGCEEWLLVSRAGRRSATPRARTSSSPATSSASRKARPGRTRSRTGPTRPRES